MTEKTDGGNEKWGSPTVTSTTARDNFAWNAFVIRSIPQFEINTNRLQKMRNANEHIIFLYAGKMEPSGLIQVHKYTYTIIHSNGKEWDLTMH